MEEGSDGSAAACSMPAIGRARASPEGPRDGDDRHFESSAEVLEPVAAEAPAKRPPGSRIDDPASDRALRSFGLIDDRD